MQAVIRVVYLSIFLWFLPIASFSQEQVPEVVVKTLDGQSVSLAESIEEGQITVVSFWATWCSPCKKELDAIAEIYDEWQENYGVALIAVSVDDARASAKVKPMVAEKGWPFKVLIDTNQDLMRSLHFQSVPYTILIDQEGTIVYTHSGYLAGDEVDLESEIANLLQ